MVKPGDGPSSVLSAEAFIEMPYSPAVLLEASLGANITDEADFRTACEWGFDAYFEGMYQTRGSQEELVFVEECYSWTEIVEFVVEEILFEDPVGTMTPHGWRAGFVLGWLSALALVNRADATRAVTLLTALLLPSHRTVA